MKIKLKIKRFLLLCAALTLASSAPADAAANPNARAAVVENFSGAVTAAQSGSEFPVFNGLALLRGDGVSTGMEAWSLLELGENRFAIVEENTAVRIDALADGLIEDSRTTRVYMSEGKVWFDVARELDEDESFEVKTSVCTLSVRGTLFSLTVEPGGTTSSDITSLAVYSGVVAVSLGDAGSAAFETGPGKVTVSLGSGTDTSGVPNVERGALTPADMAPLLEEGEDGPGGVYELLRERSPGFTQEMEGMTYPEAVSVVEFLESGPVFPEFQASDNINVNDVIAVNDGLKPAEESSTDVLASISGSLNIGAYSFEANLASGAIYSGAMNGGYGGINFNLSGGTGSVSGNNFTLGGFQGAVSDTAFGYAADLTGSSLNGTAANGLDALGDIGASGTFVVDYSYGGLPYQIGGAIVDGQRTK